MGKQEGCCGEHCKLQPQRNRERQILTKAVCCCQLPGAQRKQQVGDLHICEVITSALKLENTVVKGPLEDVMWFCACADKSML